jgi:hypothetical protein
MQWTGEIRVRPELKWIVGEASRALACLDAERLEELALSCQALNRNLAPAAASERAKIMAEVREAAREMAVFGRVLDATRANLAVMNRLKELHAGKLGYEPRAGSQWILTENEHGNN